MTYRTMKTMSFALPFSRHVDSTLAMERRKCLIEVTRWLEMVAIYEREFPTKIEIEWQRGDGEEKIGYWDVRLLA